MFSFQIFNIVSTVKFCQKCIDVILKAYFLIHEIHQNYRNIQKRLTEISAQMKWTQHLDETGSLNEFKINDSSKTPDTSPVESKKKTHRIILNNESLKHKLIQDPDMHKYLVRKELIKEPVLPAGITVKKMNTNIDMTDMAPHELLELNWADDTDYDSVIPNSHVSKNHLHSNEALIMDLMEKAKKPNSNSKLDESLTVNLIETPESMDDPTDDTGIVPQDLLELKWPEEHKCTKKQFIKIPVKKLKFDENLTVKFIPKHRLCQLQESMNDVAPYELLELNWNEGAVKAELDDNIKVDIEQQTHNIDLTKWLEDQGMSTIKTNKFVNIDTQTINIQENTSTKNDIHTSVNKNATDSKNDSIDDVNNTNIMEPKTIVVEDDKPNVSDVEITAIEEQKNKMNVDVRCALCNSIFDNFTAYTNHYKTHNIIESAKCFLCPMQFPVIELLSEHLLSVHLENIAYCNVCFAMLSQDKLAEHMSTYHAKIVEIINLPNDNDETSTVLSLADYCKKCKQPLKNSSSDVHVCVEAKSRCKECKHGCIHEKYLASYREQLRAKAEIFKCPDCQFMYKTRREIIQHANKSHLEHKPHSCKQCNIGFLLKTSLARHNNLYHARCDTCRKVFKDTDALNKHRCNSGTRNDFKCELCGQSFTESKYQQHKQTSLAAPDECVICRQAIPIKCNMSRHMQDLHNLSLKKTPNSTIYECIICEVDFKNVADFSQHAWVHTGVHECHVCAKRFSSKVLYDTHYKMHLAMQCDSGKQFKCTICKEQMVDKYAYAHHMQGHGDHGKCPICSKYVKNDELSNHIEKHEVSDGKFKCPHCSLISNSHSQFEVHVNRFHLQNRPYQCDICKKRFYSKHLMRTHIKRHMGSENCSLCERKFTRKWHLDLHMRAHENTAPSS